MERGLQAVGATTPPEVQTLNERMRRALDSLQHSAQLIESMLCRVGNSEAGATAAAGRQTAPTSTSLVDNVCELESGAQRFCALADQLSRIA